MTEMNFIAKPKDHYSPDWLEYWKQNPGRHKGVGSEAAGDGDGGEGGDAGHGPEPIDPDEFASLQNQLNETVAAMQKLESNNNALLKEKKEAKKAADKAAEEAARASGDVDAIDKSWNEKYTMAVSERDELIGQKDAIINDLTAGAEARSLAAKMAIKGCAEGLLPHIKGRLKSEIKDGKPVVRILDQAGNVSAMTMDDLEREIKSIPYLAPMIVGLEASGSGAPSSSKAAGKGEVKVSEYNSWTPEKQMEFTNNGGVVVD